MSNTPYYDAYKKYKASKNNHSNLIYSIDKKYITLSTGETILEDIKFFDIDGNIIQTQDVFSTL
jgi:hypothetical protein